MDQATQARNKNLYRIAGIIGAIMLALAVYGLLSGSNRFALGSWLAMAAVCGAAIVLTRRNRRDLGVGLMLGVTLVSLPFSSFVAQGAGIFMGLIAVAFSGVCAFLALSPRWRIWALLAGIVSAASCLLLDVFGSPARPTPLNFTLTFIISLAVLALYAFFVLRQFPNFSLREKIIVVSLALTLVPLAILVFFNNRASTEILTQRTGVALKNLADTQARNVAGLLEQETGVLDVLAFDSAILTEVEKANEAYTDDANATQAQLTRLDQIWRAADAANNDADVLVASRLNNTASDALRRFRAAYPNNVEVFVTDRYGANVAVTNRTSDFYQADEAWWQAAYNNGQGAVYISQPIFDESSQTNAINIATPLYAADGQTVQGILRTTFSIQALAQVLENVRLGETGYAQLWLPDDQLIGNRQAGAPEPQTLSRLRNAPEQIVEVVGPGLASRFYSRTPIQATTGAAAAPAITNLGWDMLARQDRAEVLAPIEAQTRDAITIALVVALASALIALGGAELLTRPITRLTATANQVRAGDLQARAVVETHDEIGELATTFNQMTAQLSGLVGNLEQRVSDRTKELESNNAYYVSLQDISVALLKRRDVEALLQDIIERAGDLVGTKNGYVFLLDRATQAMTMRVGVGSYHDLVGAQARLGVGLAGQVWETGQTLAVDDYREWGGRLADPSRDVLRAVIGVPLQSGAQVIGVIGLAHLDADKKFGPTEVDVLKRFAALAALALDNAQLLDASQHELAQRQSTEQFLDSIIENLPTMLFVKDAQNLRFVRWNKTGEEITGHARQELLGKSDYDFFPTEEADFFAAKDRETLNSGQTLIIPEEPIQAADGTQRWLRTAKVPVKGADGKPVYLLGISEDITERKRTQEREAFQTALIAAQFQISPDGILVVGADEQILSANRRFAEMWGVPEEVMATDSVQAVRQAVHDNVMDPEGWTKRSAEIYADRNSASRDTVEFRDGRVFERYSAPVTAPDGSYLARVWFFHDISDIRRAESLVQRVTQDAHAAFWSARVTKLDDETQEANGYRWKTEYANPDAIRQLAPIKMEPGQSFNDAWYATWDAQDKELMNQHSARAFREGLDRYTQEFRFYDANGDVHWMSEEARIHRQSETEFVVTGVSTEITATKKAEQAVREREELYRSLVDVIPQALTRKDREGRVEFGNARYFEDTLMTPEALYGKTDFDFHPREHAEKYWQDDLRVLRDGETLETIEPHRRGDGKDIIVRVIKSPIRNLAGEIDGIQTMFWDITEEQLRQEQINRQNMYLNALQNVSVGLMQRLDVNAVLQDIVARAGQLVGTENGYVFLREPGADEMEMRVGVGAYEGFVGRRAQPGVGLAGEVWARNEPIVVDDYRNYGGRLQDASRDILRGVVGVPLRSGSEVIGVIGLAYLDPEQKFGEQEVQALERFAQLAAIALDNARLYESAQIELTERARAEQALALQLHQTELVNRVTAHAVSFDVDRALGEICEELANYFGADQAGIALLSQDKSSLMVVAERHPQDNPSVIGYEIPVTGNPSTEIVMQTRRPAAFADAQHDPRLAAIHELMAMRRTASILIAPLFAREDIIGTLGIDWQTQRDITPSDLDLVERAALSISTALENARLYNSLQQELGERTRAETQARQRNLELESLNRVASAMMSNEPIEDSLTQMARELVKTFRARNCGIALLNSERTDLVVVADALAQEHEQHSVGIVIPVKGNLSSEYVIETKKSLVISDPQNDPLTETIHERMRDRQTTCLAIIPLLSGDQVIGTIGLDTTDEGRAFSADEIRVAETMASQMANALEKQRLLEATQREVVQRTRAEQVQSALFRIADAVNTSDADADFYQTLHGLLAELVYAPNMYVALHHPADDTLEFVYFKDEVDPLPAEAGKMLPAGKRITAWVIRQGLPLFGDAPTIRAMIDRGEVEMNGNLSFEWLGVPLKRGAETFGMFAVQSYEGKHSYTPDEMELLFSLAPEIANAITRRQEQEALVRRNRELAVLNRVTQAAAAGTELADTLDTMAREMVAVFQARNCGIALYAPDQTELVVVASATLQPGQPNTVGVHIPIANNPSTQRVLETRQSLVIENAQTDSLTEPIHGLMQQFNTYGLMIVPLLSGGQVIGTVGLDMNDPTRSFSPQDVTLAETIASQMANAIEKQRLFEQTRERAQEMSALNEIANVIAQELTLERLYESVREQVSNIMPTDAFFVMLYDRASDSAAYPYVYDDGQVHTSSSATRTVRANLRTVIESGKPLLVNRSSAEIDDMRTRMSAETGIGNVNKASASLMYVPMRRGNEIVGCISAQSYTLNAYTERHTILMEGIANHMVVALQNARLFEATQQRAQETAIINELAREISGELDQDKLFAKVYKQLARLMKAEAFVVWFYDEASHTVTRPGLYDLGEQYPARSDPAPLSPRLESIVESNRPFILNRTRSDWEAECQRTANIFGSSKPSASLLFAPLRFGNRVRGIISAQSYAFDAYGEPQEALLVSIANQMAAALENAQLFQGTQQAADRFATLNRIARAVTTPASFDEMAREIYREIAELLKPDAFLMALYVPETDELDFRLSIDRGVEYLPERAPLRETLSGRVITGDAALLIPDLSSTENPNEGVTFGSEMQVRTWLGVPLRSGEKRIGVMAIESYTPNQYGETESRLLQTIADQIGVAVERAQLFDESERRLRQVTILHDSMQTLAQQVDLDALLQQLTSQFAFALDVDTVAVTEWDAAARAMTTLYDHDLEPTTDAPKETRFTAEHYPGLQDNLMQGKAETLQRSDPHLSSALRQDLERGRWQTVLRLPLLRQNQFVGAIELGDRRAERQFTPDEIRLASSLANQASVLLENVKLFQETQTALNETEILYRTGSHLNQVDSLQELVRVAAQPAFERGAGSAQLLLLEYDTHGVAAAGHLAVSLLPSGQEAPTIGPLRFPVQEYPLARVLLSNLDDLIWVENIDTSTLDQETRKILLTAGTHSIVFMPLRVEQRILGVVTIGWGEPHTFTEQEQRIYRGLASQMALVLNNRLLLEQTQAALAESQALYQTGAQLNAATTLSEAMRAASEIGIESGADRATLMLLASDARGRPEWGTIAATWASRTDLPTMDNMRFNLNEVPLSNLWIENPAEPLLIADIEVDPRVDENARALYRYSQVRATALLPMRAGARWVALHILSWPEPHTFSDRDARLYRAVMAQAATVLDNRQLFDQTQEALAETQTLYEVGTRLNAAATLQEALEAAAGPAIVMGAATASLLRVHLDEQGEPRELELVALWPREASHASAIGSRFPAENLLGDRSWMEQANEPYVFDDIETAPNVSAVAKAVYARRGIKASALLPLKIGGRWIGVLSQNWSTPHPFTPRERRVLRSIMAQAATVLDNRALFEQTQVALQQTQDALVQMQQTRDRLNLQYETAQLLAGATAFDEVSSQLLEMICGALHWQVGEYWAVDEVAQRLTLRQVWGSAAPKIQTFIQDTVGMTFGYGEGFVGAIWSERKQIWSADVLTDARLRQSETARAVGLVSAFGFPLASEDKMYGAAVFFSDHFQPMDDLMIVTMTGVGRQIAQYMQRREAEAALETSQAQLSEAMRITHLGSWEYDVAQDLFTLTPEFYAMLRMSEPEPGGYAMSAREFIRRFVHPDDASLVVAAGRAAVQTTDPHYEHELDYRALFGDGAVGNVTARIRVVQDATGKTIRTFGTNLDITERKRAEETMRQQNAYLTALHDTTLGLMRRLDLEELLQNIIARAGELIGTEHGYVHLVEPNGKALRMRVGIGLYHELVGALAKPGQGLAGTVWQNSEPLVVDDYQTWQGRLQTASRDVLHAVVGVPLKSGDETVGVLGLASVEKERVFTPAEVEAVKRFAELAAVALDNAQLYESTQTALQQTRRTAEREKRIAEITDRLYAAPDIELVLKAAAEELQRTTGSKRAIVRLNLKDNGTNGND